MQHLIREEAPTFLVVCTVLYRALVEAVGTQAISAWYPMIVSKLKAEVQEGLHGFIRWLNAKTTKVRRSFDGGPAVQMMTMVNAKSSCSLSCAIEFISVCCCVVSL